MLKKTCLAAVVALVATGSVAHAATLLQNGSFEDDPAPGSAGLRNGVLFGNLTSSAQGWDIYSALPGWTATGGAGIEVQTDKAVGQTDAQFGEHYVELDSNNNSSMRQTLSLTAGRYLLSFWYSPRALQGNAQAQTNGISYAIADISGSVTGPGGVNGTTVGAWTEITGVFKVGSDGFYHLDFAAVGTSDSYGGFVDNVSVSAVPVPAAGLLLLSVLGGLAALRRRVGA